MVIVNRRRRLDQRWHCKITRLIPLDGIDFRGHTEPFHRSRQAGSQLVWRDDSAIPRRNATAWSQGSDGEWKDESISAFFVEILKIKSICLCLAERRSCRFVSAGFVLQNKDMSVT